MTRWPPRTCSSFASSSSRGTTSSASSRCSVETYSSSQLARLVEGAVEHAREGGADLRLLRTALDRRLAAQASSRPAARSSAGVRHELLRQLLVEQREQQVLGIDLRVAHPARELLRGADGLLDLERELVEVHLVPPSVRAASGSSRQSTSSRACTGVRRRASRSRSSRSHPLDARAASAAADPRAGAPCSTPARLSPSSVVSCWISRSRSRSASE